MKMRKVLILFLILLASSESFAQGGWILRNSGTTKNLRSIASAHGFFAVAVGDSGTVVNSQTQGVQWQVQKRINWKQVGLVPNTNLFGITAINNDIYCAVGVIDTVFRSVDRGKTWEGERSNIIGKCLKKNAYIGTSSFAGIDYDSISHLCVAVGGGAIATFSLDSGKSWVMNPPDPLWPFLCVSIHNGVVLTSTGGFGPGHTFITKDMGDYWDNQWVLSNTPLYGCSLLGWTLVGYGGAVYHSIDKGINWDTIQIHATQNLNAVHFATNAIGYLCGDSGLIYFTTDGGYNWQRQKSPTTKNLRSIHMTDAFHGFICGDSGVILTTTNGGYTADDDVISPSPSSGSYSLRSYPNPSHGRTRIEIFIPNRSHVRLRIYNMLGIEVTTLANNDFESGTQNFDWSADGLASGIYICKMEVDGRNVVSEITLTK